MILKNLLFIIILGLLKQRINAEIKNIAELYNFYSTDKDVINSGTSVKNNNNPSKSNTGLKTKYTDPAIVSHTKLDSIEPKNSHVATTTILHASVLKNETQQANQTVTNSPTLPAKTVLDKKVAPAVVLTKKLDIMGTKNSHVAATKTLHATESGKNNLASVLKNATQQANQTVTNSPTLPAKTVLDKKVAPAVVSTKKLNIMGAKNSHTAATTTQHGTEFDKNNSRSSSLNVNFKSTKSGFKNETQQANKTVTRNPALPAKTVLDKKVTQTIVLNTKLYSTEAKNSHAMATKTQHSIEIDHNNSNNVNPTSTTGAFKTGTQKANKTDTNNPILDKEFGTINIAKLYNFSKPNNTNEKALQINQTFQSAESVARQLYTRTKSNLANIADLYFFTGDQPQGIFNCSYDDTINITDYEPLVNGSYLYENHLLIPPHLVGLYDYEIVFDGSKRFAPLHKRACVCHLKNCITLCSDSILDFYQDAFEAGDQEFLKLFSIRTTLSNGSVVFKNIVNDFEHIILNEFCEPFVYPLSPEKDPKSSWTLFENGTLLRHSDNDYLKKTEYCFELYEDKFNNVMYYLVNPLNCAKENDKLKPIDRFSNWIQVFSIPFFIAIIIAYSCLPELRNVHGKCFISYLICLTMSYGILSYINLSKEPLPPVPCSILAYMHHYMQLSHYTWLGIICYDTWKSCDSTSYDQPYWKYALYGVNLPLLLTLMAFAAQKSNLTNVWKPGITQFKCGLEVNSLAAFFYLFGPCLIVLIFCLRAFCLTYTIIQTNDKKVTKIKDKSCESPRHRFFLYLRLFLMMGLSWFMDVISYFLALVGMKFLSGLIDYINAMQGLFIFASFIGRKRVRQIIRQRIHTKYHRMS